MSFDGQRRSGVSLKWALLVLMGVALVVVGGPFVYFHFVEGKAPAPLRLPTVASASGPVAPGPVSGDWTVSTGSQAGYRVHEILFGQSHTAVGRTSGVTGTMLISGTEVSGAEFTVDMASIKSDQPSRDIQFHGYIMETYKYPHANFRLTAPIQLGSIPAAGKTVTAQATGDLTMRGETESVSFTVSAERVGAGIDVTAEIPVTFSRWHIPNPSFAVAQVGSTGDIEVLLDLVRSPT